MDQKLGRAAGFWEANYYVTDELDRPSLLQLMLQNIRIELGWEKSSISKRNLKLTIELVLEKSKIGFGSCQLGALSRVLSEL